MTNDGKRYALRVPLNMLGATEARFVHLTIGWHCPSGNPAAAIASAPDAIVFANSARRAGNRKTRSVVQQIVLANKTYRVPFNELFVKALDKLIRAAFAFGKIWH